MAFKIKTSKKTALLMQELSASTNIANFALAKLAISMSLKSMKRLSDGDFQTDNYGIELNRQTITGEFDELFKCLIMMFEKQHLKDHIYFQKYLKAHLDRGVRMIYNEYRYSNDFILGLLNKEIGI